MSELVIPKSKRVITTQKALDRTLESVLELASHTIVMLAALGSIWLVHWVLKQTLGEDATFFHLLPIRWLVEAADMVVMGKFLWQLFRGFSVEGE